MPAGISYSRELAEKICDLIADGKSLEKIGGMKGFPAKRTIYRHLAEHKEFDQLYLAAMRMRGQDEFEAIEEFVMSDKALANPAWARVVMDSKRWRLSKMFGSRYGDKIMTEISGPEGQSLTVQFVRAEQKQS